MILFVALVFFNCTDSSLTSFDRPFPAVSGANLVSRCHNCDVLIIRTSLAHVSSFGALTRAVDQSAGFYVKSIDPLVLQSLQRITTPRSDGGYLLFSGGYEFKLQYKLCTSLSCAPSDSATCPAKGSQTFATLEHLIDYGHFVLNAAEDGAGIRYGMTSGQEQRVHRGRPGGPVSFWSFLGFVFVLVEVAGSSLADRINHYDFIRDAINDGVGGRRCNDVFTVVNIVKSKRVRRSACLSHVSVFLPLNQMNKGKYCEARLLPQRSYCRWARQRERRPGSA